MTTTVEVTIGYKIPDEYDRAEQFKAENPDWSRIDTTQYIYFTKKTFYVMESEEDHD